MSTSLPWRKRQAGFTLVEIIVTILIIATLGVLLMPVSQRLLGRAKAARCTNNMRGLGTALNLYLVENQNTFPTLVAAREDKNSEEASIDNTLDKYTDGKEAFCCVADSKKLCEKTGTSYYWNTVLNNQNAGSLSFLITKDATRIPVISDKENFHKYQGIEVNILYADGHVAKEVQFKVNP